MNILIFNWRDTTHSWAGGGEIYISEQASRWVKMGHKVTLYCGQDLYKKLPAFEVIDGIRIFRKGGRFSVYFWTMWRYLFLSKDKFDIVIDVENGIPFFTPIFCKIPIVCFVHHVHDKQFFYELPRLLATCGYLIERFIFPIVYRNIPIVSVSKTTQKELVKIGFQEKNIQIVYNGLNKTGYSNKTPKKFSNPTILYLGRIKKYKRVNLLVDIYPKIVEKVPNVKLIIAGWGTEASHLADIIMLNPLYRKISLVGPVSNKEKKALLSKSWIFVNPSIGEGWSIAVIEANLYGTPAVSFNVSGLAESIKHGETGLLAKDEEDLINKICEVLKDGNLREKLSKNATDWSNNFSWDHSAKESLQILETVMKKN